MRPRLQPSFEYVISKETVQALKVSDSIILDRCSKALALIEVAQPW